MIVKLAEAVSFTSFIKIISVKTQLGCLFGVLFVLNFEIWLNLWTHKISTIKIMDF